MVADPERAMEYFAGVADVSWIGGVQGVEELGEGFRPQDERERIAAGAA